MISTHKDLDQNKLKREQSTLKKFTESYYSDRFVVQVLHHEHLTNTYTICAKYIWEANVT